MTTNGLYASARVPFHLAIAHLYDLSDENAHRVRWTEGDNGDIYGARDAVLDRQHGLRLTFVPLVPNIPEEKEDHGPQVGCPASLVPEYIEKVHQIAADACVAGGLLITE